MKMFKTFLMVFLCLLTYCAKCQIVSLSYPINNGVIQRGSANSATVTIAGQLISSNLSVTLSYRFRTVSSTGVAGTPGSATTMTLAPNGMFYVLPVVSKGWYLCEILLNGVVYASSKFGVGDVFIIAGQSNAQGFGDNSHPLPSSTGIPEWIIGTSEDNTCTNKLPQTFNSLFSLNTSDNAKRHGRLGPTGNGIWAYAALGKQISDANSGMPVAFFNAASGGTSIVEWKQGADGIEAKHPYTGAQMCLGYNGGSTNPADYYGQPYTPLKTALNYYGSLFGVRAVLWHQGEADADPNVLAIYKASSSADYQSKLQAVMTKARTDFGASGLAWYISKATISKPTNINATIRSGQTSAASGSPNNAGPDTDYDGVSTTENNGGDEYRLDSTHFYEGSGSIKGLTFLSNKWYSAVGGSVGSPVAASYVPLLLYSKSGDWRTLTAPSGGVTYKWNSTHINGATESSSSVFTTDESWLGIRCYMKDGTGKWHISPTISVGQFSSQRLAANAEADEIPGFELNTFPNPYVDSFTAEFYVPAEHSHVKLEIIDNQGKVIKTVVDNPHAKGKWTYPVKDLVIADGQVVFARLKIDEAHTIKKLIRASK